MINDYYTPKKFFEQNEASTKYPDEFNRLLDLFNESENVKEILEKYRQFTSEQKACSLVFMKSQHLVISILKLSNMGIAENAGILLRSLYENYIQMRYLNELKLGRQFLNYRIASFKKYMDSYENQFPNSKLITPEVKLFKQKLNKSFKQIAADYVNEKGEIRERWHKKGTRGMAKELNEMLSYNYIMTIYSAFVHCDVTGMAHYMIETDDHIEYNNSPTTAMVDEVLTLSYQYFGRIVAELIGTYKIEIPKAFIEFSRT